MEIYKYEHPQIKELRGEEVIKGRCFFIDLFFIHKPDLEFPDHRTVKYVYKIQELRREEAREWFSKMTTSNLLLRIILTYTKKVTFCISQCCEIYVLPISSIPLRTTIIEMIPEHS